MTIGILPPDLAAWQVAALALGAVVTSAIHGATGLAGGFLLAAILAPIVGVKAVVPVMSIALLISHGARAALNLPDFDRRAFLWVLLPALPGLVFVSTLYAAIPARVLAALLAAVILSSIPLRRWAARRRVRAGRGTLAAAGALYGTLSGATLGPGMILVPALLGTGMNKEAFVATLAAIAMVVNVVRVGVYGATGALDPALIWLGLGLGVLTIPGNWIGRAGLRRMTGGGHAAWVDVLTVVGALNFLWLAFAPGGP